MKSWPSSTAAPSRRARSAWTRATSRSRPTAMWTASRASTRSWWPARWRCRWPMRRVVDGAWPSPAPALARARSTRSDRHHGAHQRPEPARTWGAEINNHRRGGDRRGGVAGCDRRLVGGRLAGAERDRQHHAGDHGWRADRRRAGDHGQPTATASCGRGVGERGRGPGRRLARGRRRQCAQPDRSSATASVSARASTAMPAMRISMPT